MRYPASEKLEIIRTVKGSHLPVKQTLDMLGIPRTTCYRWYDLYVDFGLDGLADRSPRPGSVWNRIPDVRRDDLIEFALEHEALTTRELAVKYTDEKRYFISESSAYRILKAADLITAPDYVVIKAADEFTDKTTAINEMWQTDFTYFKIIGWGWYYLSTILDDYSRYIIAWKLCTNMRAEDVTDTIELALTASGCDQAIVRHKPRLLSDNGSCYISADLAKWLEDQKMTHVRGAPFHPQTQGKIERWHQTMKNRVLLENYYGNPPKISGVQKSNFLGKVSEEIYDEERTIQRRTDHGRQVPVIYRQLVIEALTHAVFRPASAKRVEVWPHKISNTSKALIRSAERFIFTIRRADLNVAVMSPKTVRMCVSVSYTTVMD